MCVCVYVRAKTSKGWLKWDTKSDLLISAHPLTWCPLRWTATARKPPEIVAPPPEPNTHTHTPTHTHTHTYSIDFQKRLQDARCNWAVRFGFKMLPGQFLFGEKLPGFWATWDTFLNYFSEMRNKHTVEVFQAEKKSFLCNKWQSVFGWHPGKLVRLYLKQHDTQGALTFISCPRLQKVSKQTDSSVSGVGWLTCCRHLGPHHVTHSPSPRHWATALLDVGERGYCPWGPVGVSFKSHLPWLPERALTASSTGASTLKKELLGALQENASSVVSIYPLSTELSSENIHAYTGT